MADFSFSVKACLLVCSLLVGGCASFGSSNSDVKAQLALMDLIDGFLSAGEKLYRADQLELAETQFLEVLAIEESNVGALYRLGNIEFRKGRLDKALAYFDRVIVSNPSHSRSHYNIAVINLMKAEQHFQSYTASEDPSKDLTKVTEILSDINAFATKKKTKKELKLEKLWQALENN